MKQSLRTLNYPPGVHGSMHQVLNLGVLLIPDFQVRNIQAIFNVLLPSGDEEDISREGHPVWHYLSWFIIPLKEICVSLKETSQSKDVSHQTREFSRLRCHMQRESWDPLKLTPPCEWWGCRPSMMVGRMESIIKHRGAPLCPKDICGNLTRKDADREYIRKLRTASVLDAWRWHNKCLSERWGIKATEFTFQTRPKQSTECEGILEVILCSMSCCSVV